MIVNCHQCGRNIRRKQSQLNRNENNFCSKECHNVFMRKGSLVVCKICGRSFYKSPSKIIESNLCSRECRNIWMGQRNVEIINVVGHSKGHKAPHLTILNRLRNPLSSISAKTYEAKDINSKKYRSIVEIHIGRKLNSNQVVHHVNGIKTDNRFENLRIMSNSEHHKLHMEIACKKFKSCAEKEMM